MGTHSERKRVAVIGAGLGGLVALRHFSRDPQYETVCYEVQDRIGGLWNYPDGCEDHPEAPITSPYYCRMFRDLFANGSRKINEFRELPLPASSENFPHRQTIIELMKHYALKFGLIELITFRQHVTLVTPLRENKSDREQWKVTTTDLDKGISIETVFDAVLICTGHAGKPYLPDMTGMELFAGPVIHSSTYRNREKYANQTVLVIGGAVSANEITCELLTVSRQVIVCRRTQQLIFSPDYDNVIETTLSSVTFTKTGVTLQSGGDIVPVDHIILCTGFHFDFPYLSKECIVTVTRGRVAPLYRHLINCRIPSMAFIGLFSGGAHFRMGVEEQVRFFKAVLDGSVQLPSRDKMLEETDIAFKERLRQGFPAHHAHRMREKIWDYAAGLAEDGGFEPPPAGLKDLFIRNIHGVLTDPCNFRHSTT